MDLSYVHALPLDTGESITVTTHNTGTQDYSAYTGSAPFHESMRLSDRMT